MNRLVTAVLCLSALFGCGQVKDSIEYGYSKGGVVSTYESRYGDLSTKDQEHVYQSALQACHYLSTTGTFEELLRDMTDSGIPDRNAATIVAAAVVYICPENQ